MQNYPIRKLQDMDYTVIVPSLTQLCKKCAAFMAYIKIQFPRKFGNLI